MSPTEDTRPAAGLTVAELRALIRTVLAESEPTAPAPPALLTQDELARELRTSTRTVREHARLGMPELRIGDSPRYELGPVLTWLRGRE